MLWQAPHSLVDPVGPSDSRGSRGSHRYRITRGPLRPDPVPIATLMVRLRHFSSSVVHCGPHQHGTDVGGHCYPITAAVSCSSPLTAFAAASLSVSVARSVSVSAESLSTVYDSALLLLLKDPQCAYGNGKPGEVGRWTSVLSK